MVNDKKQDIDRYHKENIWSLLSSQRERDEGIGLVEGGGNMVGVSKKLFSITKLRTLRLNTCDLLGNISYHRSSLLLACSLCW